ncbi:hypothetical protein DICPUDRAFT_86952 [Dictyostelium purpureum]|uniref:PPM-type phosphatase domain-containing protein n=1 Tax=Dictyostelium purpureum TaxID=5786 RepID=F0ZF03_DICPU|nr:uncharacterized protein DICPUDRAFT_86952 [Dictyostelium purpureum]EGC37523.1 hypothetical protein DICPUDRAFT_86952 [Dictyostelium purpureum]|eukprot:XP_003285997.1 hypothetical protein DICPUDRAFT_86952 [Dictyostelium purpureum]
MNQIKLVNTIIKETVNKSTSILKSTSKNYNTSYFKGNLTGNTSFLVQTSNFDNFNINQLKSYCTNTKTTTTTTNTMIDTMTMQDVDANCLSTTIGATTISDNTNIVDQAMEEQTIQDRKSIDNIDINNENNNIEDINKFNTYNNNNNIDNNTSEDEININNVNNNNNENINYNEEEFHLHSGICVIPHPNKRHKGGEDAHFISVDRRVIGVADGVGGWGDVGIDPSEYSNTLMEGSKIASDSIQCERDPLIIMEQGYQYSQDVKGSSTCCIVVLGGKTLLSANLGDSGFLVVRNGEVIFRTREQQHAFNMPFQLGTQSVDRPINSVTASFPVEKGDLIVMGTDGVFDNLFDDEIVEIGEKSKEPQTIARSIAKRAFEVGCSTTIYTPFAKNAGHNGYIYNGGKLDDITVIVSIVQDGPIQPIKTDLLLLDEQVKSDYE